jgi:hypothetical protein
VKTPVQCLVSPPVIGTKGMGTNMRFPIPFPALNQTPTKGKERKKKTKRKNKQTVSPASAGTPSIPGSTTVAQQARRHARPERGTSSGATIRRKVRIEPSSPIVEPSSLLLYLTFRDVSGMGRSLSGGGRKFRPRAGTGTGMGLGCRAAVSGDREAGDLGEGRRGSPRWRWVGRLPTSPYWSEPLVCTTNQESSLFRDFSSWPSIRDPFGL